MTKKGEILGPKEASGRKPGFLNLRRLHGNVFGALRRVPIGRREYSRRRNGREGTRSRKIWRNKIVKTGIVAGR